jgi:hypothetical protein
MRLRAQIVVDVWAEDFVQAAEHQSRLADFVQSLKQAYPEAMMTIKERRERKPEAVNDSHPLRPLVGVRQAKVG